jgi:large subunit ribosomal protein L17
MNHGTKQRKFNRNTGHRKALILNLAKALIRSEQITTTLPKAKDLRPVVEKIITKAKKGDLAARREIISFMRGNTAEVKKLFDVLAARFKDRNGGYIRVLKAGYRKGDCAPMAVIEFV